MNDCSERSIGHVQILLLRTLLQLPGIVDSVKRSIGDVTARRHVPHLWNGSCVASPLCTARDEYICSQCMHRGPRHPGSTCTYHVRACCFSRRRAPGPCLIRAKYLVTKT